MSAPFQATEAAEGNLALGISAEKEMPKSDVYSGHLDSNGQLVMVDR